MDRRSRRRRYRSRPASNLRRQFSRRGGQPAGRDRPHRSTAALNGNFGRGTFTIAGSVDRTIYENATSGGVPVDQGYRTNTVFGSRLRVGYEATASLTPFVEGEFGAAPVTAP